MQLNYRKGRLTDAPQLRKLALASYGQFQKDLTPENWEKFHGLLAAESSYINILKIAQCFICEKGEEIIGVAYIVPSGNPTELFQSDWSYIRMVAVNPEYRGNGISKKLTQMCIDFASENNEKIIALHTSEFMDAARHIYESLGFNKIKELDPLFGKKYWLYQLHLATA
jgi:ribosomal protein S18 acetylase RimI-like enzyme